MTRGTVDRDQWCLVGVSLVAVVLLAKSLRRRWNRASPRSGFPQSFVGVVIAALVLLPEGTAAVLAARSNQFGRPV